MTITASIISDVHLGNPAVLGGPRILPGINRRGGKVLDVLQRAVDVADERGDSAIFVAGDFSDQWRPSPQLIDRALRVMRSFQGDWHIIVGNHDILSAAEGDHALAPFDHVDGIHIHDRPCVVRLGQFEFVLAPFQPGKPEDYLVDALKETCKSCSKAVTERALVLHAGLRDAPMVLRSPWCGTAVDAIDVDVLARLCKAHGINQVFAGNWHERTLFQVDGVDMCQVGALCPTGWDNPGLHGFGSVEHYADVGSPDGQGWTGNTVVQGPRFLHRVPGEALPEGCQPYVSLAVPRDEARDAQRILDRAKADGRICDGMVVVEQDESFREACRKAVFRMRSNGALEQALDRYLETATFPQGVTVEAVRAACSELLGGA